MEKGDIGVTVHKHVACMFEDLLMHRLEVAPEKQRRFFKKRDEELTEEQFIQREVRLWRPNDLPIKAVIHLTTKLATGVEVYTFMDPIFQDAIEHWLARKGVNVSVYPYYNLDDLYDDFKLNRDVNTFYTTNEEHARRLGMRATVVKPDGTFGF